MEILKSILDKLSGELYNFLIELSTIKLLILVIFIIIICLISSNTLLKQRKLSTKEKDEYIDKKNKIIEELQDMTLEYREEIKKLNIIIIDKEKEIERLNKILESKK